MSTLEVTYETGIDEPLHPDCSIALRMEEVAMSDCKFGCKIYADPRSQLRVLGHFRVYGCTVTQKEISREHEQPARPAAQAGRELRDDRCTALPVRRSPWPSPSLM